MRHGEDLREPLVRRQGVELCVEPAGLCGRCTGVAVPLRVVPSPTGSVAMMGKAVAATAADVLNLGSA